MITVKKATETEQLIARYEGILTQIKDITGEHDIDQLVVQFERQEAENFAVLNYVNEINDEVYVISLLT